MLPLGVVAYPAVSASTTPLDASSSIWTTPWALKSRRLLSKRTRLGQGPSRFSSTLRRSRFSPALSKSSAKSLRTAPLLHVQQKHGPLLFCRHALTVRPCHSSLLSEPESSETLATLSAGACRSLSAPPLSSRTPSAASSSRRPRHVKLVTPNSHVPRPVFTLPNPSQRQRLGDRNPLPALTKIHSVNMARQAPNISRANTMESQTSAPSPSQIHSEHLRSEIGSYVSSVNSSQTSLSRHEGQELAADRAPLNPMVHIPVSGSTQSPAIMQTAGVSTPSTSTTGLSGLVCNVHRTTGDEPRPLVGATTTILGDKLYVFGGRRLSRTKPQLTSDLYELDLLKRHWTKLDAKGDVPPPRYFHSVCTLGDTKLVCYGGMSPVTSQGSQSAPTHQQQGAETQPEVVVKSDVHIYDVPTRTWMHITTADSPQGRYAHCATILPSSTAFTSSNASLSSVRHNPSMSNPNQGIIGAQLDGEGGAEMVVVGGQDSANHYIEQISVFNLRSLKWTATNTLGRSCGAYRSVVAPLNNTDPSRIGAGVRHDVDEKTGDDHVPIGKGGAFPMLIYSNYNFLDVKLELQIRHGDGTLSEKPMHGSFSPPGLRFPNGGVINNHFVFSGTFLTSSKQEYALWALDLRNLSWARIEAGGSIFSQGSWNRGVLWNRRNCFVILGNRKRSLVEDYNHRRLNFSNICVVELEAFGLYDNPRKSAPNSAYSSVSAPLQTSGLDTKAGGRQLSSAAAELGQRALGMRELADMDFLAVGGERIPVNSHLIARRWGPYFNQLLRDSTSVPEGADTATLRPSVHPHPSRNSSITITPSIRTNYSNSTTLANNSGMVSDSATTSSRSWLDPPDPANHPPAMRPRTLYLPHTHLTIQSLTHYFYTSSLPPSSSPLSSPQILCSLLQLARPYHIDGLLEAVIERLHALLDGRNTAAIFNAAAMAAGGGSGIGFMGVNGIAPNASEQVLYQSTSYGSTALNAADAATRSLDPALRALRINTDMDAGSSATPSVADDDVSSATSTSTSASGDGNGPAAEREAWAGDISAVVGLQKRGLRGLMEGRRIREMGRATGRGRDEGSDGVGLGLLASGT